MKIENVDALKQWLVSYLQPIFDGDPDKLAMYIVAYSKKIENDQASRERCIKDLEVFLESNTNSFVETLFETLVSKKYLNSASNSNNQTTTQPTEQKTDDRKKEYNESSASYRHDRERDRSRRFNSSYDESRRQKHTADYHSNRSSGGGSGNGYRARQSRDYQEIDSNRSRSSKTRYKNRSRNRHRDASSSSSSSSSSSNNPSSSRRFEGERKNIYRRSYSRSRSKSYSPKVDTKKQRCKNFDEEGICRLGELCPYDHGGEVVIAPLMPQQQHQQPINQPDINTNQLLQQPNNYQLNNPIFNNNTNQNDMFNQRRNNNNNQQKRNNQQINKSNGPGLLPMPPNFQPQQRFNNSNNNNNTRNILNTQQQQQQPQQQINNQNDMFQQQQQQRLLPNSNRPRNLVNIVTSMQQDDSSSDQTGLQQQQQQQRGIKRSYYNNNNNNNNNNNIASNNNITSQNVFTNLTSDQNSNTQIQPALLPTPNQPQLQQQQHQHQQQSQSNKPQHQNSTLILRKVPLELNKVEKMRQHFSKFGQIIDIQCQYENNNDAALIQFATNQQALAAYKSPQSVFNNRFIRIYWLSNYQKHQQQHHQQQHQQLNNNNNNNSDEPLVKRSLKERIDSSELHSTETKENKNDYTNINTNPKIEESTDQLNDVNKSTQDPTGQDQASIQQQDTSQPNPNLNINFSSLSLNKKLNYENAAKVIQDENQKKVLMLKLEVKQKARELIEKQIKDQKLLLQKYEQAKTKEEKNQILDLIKQLSASIEKEKEILSNKNVEVNSPSAATNMFSAHSPFSFQKVPPKTLIIPPPVHHLKLNNKRLNNTSFLKNQSSAKTAAVVSGATAVSTAAKIVPPAAQAPFNYARVDNRPKELLITGLESSQEKTNLISFIKTIGCQFETVNDISDTPNSVSFSINFSTRKDAEIALTKCSSSLTGKQISITWSKSDQTNKKDQIASDSEAIVSAPDTVSSKEIQSTIELADEDSKSKDKSSGVNEESSTVESVSNVQQEQENNNTKEFVDALFDDSTNYENIIN